MSKRAIEGSSEVLDLSVLKEQVKTAIRGLLEVASLKPGHIMVLGCSTSEVQGNRIGSAGSSDVAVAILDGADEALSETGVYLAVQCCEHLNRSLVVDREVVEKYHLTEVSVLPVPKAGGATAATALKRLKDAAVVESIQAHAGIDIGDTFIGMHLRPVAVPVRLPGIAAGQAHVTMARTRPRLIGRNRAVYVWSEIEDTFGKGRSK